MKPTEQKTYLGDGAYYDLDSWGNVHITAENGMATTDIVVLGPTEIEVLMKVLGRDFNRGGLKKAIGEDTVPGPGEPPTIR